jgi:hypothetical protein
LQVTHHRFGWLAVKKTTLTNFMIYIMKSAREPNKLIQQNFQTDGANKGERIAF